MNSARSGSAVSLVRRVALNHFLLSVGKMAVRRVSGVSDSMRDVRLYVPFCRIANPLDHGPVNAVAEAMIRSKNRESLLVEKCIVHSGLT